MLHVASDFFGRLNSLQVPYCHWKSNEHVMAGLQGSTDLDILIGRSYINKVATILVDLGFQRFTPVSYLSYPAIEDYLGFDKDTGKLLHIHLHYELMLGKKFIKGVRLPWESEILQDARIDETAQLRCVAPEYELILLFIRRALKDNLAKRVKRKLTGAYVFPKDEKKEYDWLSQRVDSHKLSALAENKLSSRSSLNLLKSLQHDQERYHRKTLKCIRKDIKPYYHASKGNGIGYILLKLKAVYRVISFKKLNGIIPYRRRMPAGGLIVAFMGIDGAGKSTIISKVYGWSTWKIDTQKIYFGSGDGRSSLFRMPLRIVAKIRRRVRGNVVHSDQGREEKKKKGILFRFMKVLWAITLASEKKGKLETAWKARNQGLLVLSDRYPQTDVPGVNDGPLLHAWAGSRMKLKRKVAAWENRIYVQACTFAPDVVIKLHITPEVALQRKQDTPQYVIERKYSIMEKIHLTDSAHEYEVDSSLDIEATLLEVKSIIWNYIHGKV